MGSAGSRFGIENNVTDKAVTELDPLKYEGTWYKIASYPNIWETGRCDRSIAKYKWDANEKKIRVMNRCIANGEIINDGFAWARNYDPNQPGKFKILFDGMPFEGEYWVRWTDYNTSIVGDGTGTNLWWLSRKPTVKASEVEPMLELIRTFGYNTDYLLSVPEAIEK